MDMEITIPRFAITVSSQDLDAAIAQAFETLGYDRPTRVQEEVIRAFVSGRDVFVIVPTGSGKSLCFVALPLVMDYLRRSTCRKELHHSIVVVISPLTALMKDQVAKYGSSLREEERVEPQI